MTYRHLRAFVSSRMLELAEERAAVRAALEPLYVHAFVYEQDAGARPDSARSTYLSEIDESDLYIGLFWRGYGAYTIEEYEHARRRNKPCLIYEKPADAADGRAPELQVFLDRIGAVGSGHTIARFDSAAALGRVVGSDVARWLASVVRGAGRGDAIFQAPPVSERYVERPELTARLRTLLLPPQPGAAPHNRILVLHGLAGSGKSSLARELAHDPAVLGAMPQGVLWVTLGQQPDLRQRLADWGRALGDPQLGMVGYPDVQTGTAQLRALLRERACLLIVDDAWSAEHVKAFDAGGPACAMLVTTRQGDIASSLGAPRFRVPVMEEPVALALLTKRAGDIAQEDLQHARLLAAEVGFVPLALDLLAAQVRRLGSWSALVEAWRERGARVLVRSRGAAGRADNMLDSLELSIGGLAAEDRSRFFQLGVFEEDIAFPPSAAAALWHWSAADATDLLAELVDRALLERNEADAFSLHDLLHDVAREQLGADGLARMHDALLEGYRKRCPQGWAACVPDGYLHEHLSHHLAAAGRCSELYALIDEPWMRAQFRRSYTHRQFARDVERMIAQAAGENPPRLDEEVRGSVIYATLGSLARHVPPRTLMLLVRMQQLERAAGMAALLTDPQERVQALLAIAAALEQRAETARAAATVSDAIEAARALPDGTFDQEQRRATLAQLAPFAARHGGLARWRALLDATGSAMLPAPGEHARRRALAQAAVALAEGGCTAEAQSILQALQADDPDTPDAIAPLCAAARTAQSHAEANTYVRQALALSAHARGGGDADLYTCVETLLALGSAGEAEDAIGRMKSAQHRAYAYAAAARAAFVGAAATDRGRRLAAQSLAQVHTLLENWDRADAARALAETFDVQLLAGEEALAEALATADALAAAPMGERVLSAAASALATVGRYEEAQRLIQRLAPQYRTAAVAALAVGHALNGDMEGASRLVATIEPIYRSPVLLQLAAAHRAAGRFAAARALLQDPALLPSARMQGLTELAEALLDQGDSAAANDVLAAALAGAAIAGDIGGVAEVLAAIAEAQCKAGRLEAARAFAKSAAECTARLSGWEREAATHTTACALIGCGDGQAGAALIDALPASEQLMPTLLCAARLVQEQRTDEALAWLRNSLALLASAELDAQRRRAASWLAEASARLGETALAREALAQAEAGLEALQQWDRFDALFEVAPALARLGEKERAHAVLRSADALIEQQTNQLATIASRRGEVVRRLVATGHVDAALETARAIPLAREQAQALALVASARARQDARAAAALFDEVLALIRSQTFGYERAQALAAAAPALYPLNSAEGLQAAREAASLAESVNVDRSLRAELRRTVAAALHACGAPADALALWRADLAAARLAGRAQTLQSLAAGVPLLADYEQGRLLERIGRALIAAERWWGGAPSAADRAD